MKPATESPQATVDAVPDGDRTDPVGNGGGAGGPQPAGGFGRRASPPGDGSGG